MSEATSAILEVDFGQGKRMRSHEASCHGYFFTNEKPKQGSGCSNDTPTSEGYVGDKKNDLQDITLFGYVDAYMGVPEVERVDDKKPRVHPDAILLTRLLPELIEAHPNVTDIYLLMSGRRINNVWQKAKDAENLDKVPGDVATVIEYLRGKDINLIPIQKDSSKKMVKNMLLAESMVRGTTKYLSKFSEAKGYWNNKVEVNRLLASSRWYYATDGRTAEKVNDFYVYHMGAPSKEDELLGKPESDSHYSVVFLKEPDPALTFIREQQMDAAKRCGQIGVAIARLDNILSSGNYALLDEYGSQAIDSTETGGILLAGFTLSRILNPPMLSWRAAAATQDLEDILKSYVEGPIDKRFTVTDITDQLYVKEETKKKTITKLDPDIGTGVKALPVEINFDIGVKSGKYKTRILLGVDIPRRNTLSALAEKEPKVSILSWKVSDTAFKFLTIIEADGEYGIWCGYYSNMRLILK